MRLLIQCTFLVVVLYLAPTTRADDLRFLTCDSVILIPKRWPTWHVHMGSILGELKGKDSAVELSGVFTFERIKRNQPYFYIKSKKWSEYYVYMTESVDGLTRASKTKPGPEGQWRVSRTSTGQFTLSPKKWPNWYMCMKDDLSGMVMGCKNTPGSGGSFFIAAAGL